MDLITLAMAKKYSDKKGGYTKTTKTVLLDGVFETEKFSEIHNSFFTDSFDIKDGDKISVNWNGKQYTCVALHYETTLCFGNLSLLGIPDAENTGEPFIWSLAATENGELLGMFLTTDSGSITAKVTATSETIVPIDPKYLPSAVVDLDELGLTNPIFLKFNEGGGSLDINPDNNYGIDTEKVCKAFPLDKGYNVKLTIPGMGIMAVNPVYTLFTDGKFRTVHLDSYVYIGDVLKKFYVRINGSYPDSGFYRVLFEVGFYE